MGLDHHELDNYRDTANLHEATLTIGYNRSDYTCGWDGHRDSFKIFYLTQSLEYSYAGSENADQFSHSLIHGQKPIDAVFRRVRSFIVF